MKILFFAIGWCVVVGTAFLSGSCTLFDGGGVSVARGAGDGKSAVGAQTSVRIATWNVQTFFDAVDDGNEYSQFRSSKNWTKAAYEERLEKLCDGIKKLDAEIYVLEEIENHAVVYDITNRLAGQSWYKNKKLRYAVFAKDDGSSIGCAVLSRLPVSDVRVHSLDIRVEPDRQPSMRPIIECTVTKGKKSFLLFANHWKSKSGGQEKSEHWRDWQEFVLSSKIAMGKNTVSCGDFNRDIDDFVILLDGEAGQGDVLLRGVAMHNTVTDDVAVLADDAYGIAARSPWLMEKFSEAFAGRGSYFFQEEWEAIDHFFVTGDMTVRDFSVPSSLPFAKADGTPNRYTIFNGKGCSDHLPLVCTVEF